MELNIRKGAFRGSKIHLGTAFIGITNDPQGALGDAMRVRLLVNLTISANSQPHFFR